MPRNLPTPTGNDAETEFHRSQARRTVRELPIRSSSRVKVQKTTTGTFLRTSPRTPSVNTGWNWMYPSHKEMDPTQPYSVGKVAYVSPGSALVGNTTITDLVSGTITTVRTGLWLCIQAVPAQAIVGGVLKWNLPQLPVPGATGAAPAGTPLKGDYDGANVYWIPINTGGGGCDSSGNWT